MVLLWPLGLGRAMNLFPGWLGRYMLLVTRGRRTGLVRKTPVNYAPGDGEVFCVAGYGPGSHWYRNLVAEPEVEAWLPGARWRARAETIAEPEERLRRMRQVLWSSGFPARWLAGVDPSSATLEADTAHYRVVRLTLLERL